MTRSWVEHTGRTPPVGKDVLVRCRIPAISRSDAEKRDFLPASKWIWNHPADHPGRVVEYQIGGVA